MNHENGKNLIDPAGNTGIDPETAANDIRAILDAGGKGAGILAQRGALLEWAERAGRRYRESFWIAEARIGGLEHLVWNDAENQLIRKATYGGSFGRTVRFLDRGLVPGTPLVYLDRWSLHNKLFGAITKVSGILETTKGDISILIHQQPISQINPNKAQSYGRKTKNLVRRGSRLLGGSLFRCPWIFSRNTKHQPHGAGR